MRLSVYLNVSMNL